ncbi:MAG: sulfatase [Prolixibacteraceae bacterium]
MNIKTALVPLLSLAISPLMAKNPRPNFIFILADDLGWTSSSSPIDNRVPESKSDYYETPNIDRLGNQGIRFSNGFAPASICTPSRRSIQFGQTPLRLGDVTFPENYNPKTKKWLTIPRLLKSIDAKYKTAHYGKWDLRADIFPEDLGYDESDGDTGNINGDVMSDNNTKFTTHYINNDPKRIETITKRAISFVSRQVDAGNPFYLQLSHYATHVDIQSKEKTFAKFDQKTKGRIHDNPGWAGMLYDLDAGIGKVLDLVEKLGIGDNTYIIFMADNGAVEFLPPVKNRLDHPSAFSKPMINYPLRGGKWTLYEGGIRVPFIISGPGIKPGQYCHVPVTGYDLMPTLADLAGDRKPLPGYLDGGSLRPLLKDPSNGKVQRAHSEMFFHRYTDAYPHSSIQDGDFKMIRFLKTKKIELYDLGNDPGELTDLAAKMPEKVILMGDKLDKYLKEVNSEVLRTDLPMTKKKKNNDDE